jgi:hypothetical protein
VIRSYISTKFSENCSADNTLQASQIIAGDDYKTVLICIYLAVKMGAGLAESVSRLHAG